MKEYRLEDLFDLQMGKTPSRSNSQYWNNGINDWVSIGDLSITDKYISNTKEKITDIAIDESGIKVIPRNTVIMSFKLSIGKVAITSVEMYSNEAIMAFIDRNKVEIIPDYLYYLFMGKDWDQGTNKAVMGKTLNKATLSNIKIRLHNFDEQTKIVKVLDKSNKLISLRKQQIDDLDNLIKSRFVEMFGDPKDNSKKWPVYKLDELCKVGSSKRIYQNEQTTEGIPFLRISDLVQRIETGNEDCNLFLPAKKFEELKSQGLVPNVGDVLITSRGTLGACYIVKETDCFYFQDGMISWLYNIEKSIISMYISYLFRMQGFRKQIDGLQAGSTVTYLSISMIKQLKIMLPPIDIQNQFATFVEQVDKLKLRVQESLNETQILFDSLMQKYFG